MPSYSPYRRFEYRAWFKALYHDTTGDGNTATGREALFSNTTGDANTATVRQALFSNPPAAATRPTVLTVSRPTAPGTATLPPGFRLFFVTPAASATRRSVLTPSTTQPEAVTRPLVSQLATTSRATAMSASAGAKWRCWRE